MMRWLTLTSLLFMSLAGCISESAPEPVEPQFIVDDNISHVLEAGPYAILPGLQQFVSFDIPMLEGVASATGGSVSYGVHLPEIPGCDWAATDLPEHCQLPVIADVGPYYLGGDQPVTLPQLNEGDVPVDDHSRRRLFGALVENYVPHGYAVVAVSVSGTGDSNHCQDLGGIVEQASIDAAVTALGEAAWSNGNVGLIGRSYDGTTVWEAATFGNEHLKTVVPISGLMGMYELMWRNGTAEDRGPALLWAIYQAFTIDGDGTEYEMICRNTATGALNGLGSYLTGDHFAEPVNTYWSERSYFDRVLENYEGSVFYIHGLQDWNVDPHMAFPYYQQLMDNGNDMKGLFGQWDHAYPDRRSDHTNLPSGYGFEAFPQSVRYDWAQDLLEWFDYYLKEAGPQPELNVEVQDNMGTWRVEDTYPPSDLAWTHVALDESTGWESAPVPHGLPVVTPDSGLHIQLPAIDETNDTHLAGNTLLHLQVTPTGPGGQVFAQLRDSETGLRLGMAVMDLRFAAGGTDMQPVVPGMPIMAMMEFQAFDAVLPAGHGLELIIAGAGHFALIETEQTFTPGPITNPIMVDFAGSTLKLPVDTDVSNTFLPPVGPG